jgi:2-phosphosulfolactate phosphatase
MELLKVDVIPTADAVMGADLQGATAVVIDVLRATSVMVTAFDHGVKRIIPVLEPDEAFQMKASLPDNALLGGERSAERIPGFDLDNSPYSYQSKEMMGRTIVMTTTNGTKAIRASRSAEQVLIGSFLNADAMIKFLQQAEKIVLVCAGTNGRYTLEDGLCAGYIMQGLSQARTLVKSDFAELTHVYYQQAKNEMRTYAARSLHYQILAAKGFYRDLVYCFQTGLSEKLPVLQEEGIVPLKKTNQ